MNYLNYIQSLATFSNFVVTDEINYQYNGEGDALVIKYLAGNNYKDSKVLPIQLSVYTNDLQATKTLLEDFAKTYNNAPFFYDNGNGVIDYVQAIYGTPMLLQNFDASGNNFVHQFVIAATLIISTNVSEIKQVFIDNVEYETTSRSLVFVSSVDSQRIGTNVINTSLIKNSVVKFSCNMINKNNLLLNKIRTIRQGLVSPSSTFALKFVFSDNNTEETHTMVLENAALQSENQSLPVISIAFTK
jgi:hypothetical protein